MKHLSPRLIQMLLDSEAREDETIWANRHIRDCTRCRAEYERAGSTLRIVMKDLEALDPASVQTPSSFSHPLAAERSRRPTIRVLVLLPIKVPAFLLVLMVGISLVMACLLLIRKPDQSAIAIHLAKEEGPVLTLVSSGGETRVGLNVPVSGFKPVADPAIMVIGKEAPND